MNGGDPIQPMDSMQQVDPTQPVQQSHPDAVQPTPATNIKFVDAKEVPEKEATEPKPGPQPEYSMPNDDAAYRYIPEGVQGWNWGAFMFNFYWGIGNKSYLTLFCLIPFFNIIWAFVCGIKGNEWAWINGNYSDVKTFQAVQKTWNRAGLFAFIFSVIAIVLVILFYVFIFAAIAVNYQNETGTTY